LEAEEDVVLVTVAVAAGIEHLPRGGRPRREDLEDTAQLAVAGARAVGRLARRILFPLLHQRDMRAAGYMTRFASDPHFGPFRSVLVGGDVVILDEVRRVAIDAGDVPDLPQIVVGIVRNRRDLLPVEPPLRLDVPEHGQHVDAAVWQLRKVALEAARTERIVHVELFSRPTVFRDRDEVLAVSRLHRVSTAVLLE